MRRWLTALATAGSIAAVARSRRALTADGAVAAAVVGTVVQAHGGLPAAGALVAFFVTSTALSRLGEARKRRRGVVAQGKGAERDAWQVAANGGVGAAWLLVRGAGGAPGFVGAVATACADTWATELGLLAPGRPRLITTLRAVRPGTSGGVTVQGTVAGLVGAGVVGAVWATLARPRAGRVSSRTVGRAVLLAAAAGALGSLVDSLLGATVQAAYRCTRCGEPVETPVHGACGAPATLEGGWPWVNNDAVNLLATAAGSVAGVVLAAGFGRRAGNSSLRPASRR